MYDKKNFAKGELAAQLLIAGTSLVVETDQGALFPDVGAANIFVGVIWGAAYQTPFDDASREVVTAYQASADTFTIVRAREGTSAKQWEVADNFMLIASAGVFDEYETELTNRNIAPNNLLKNGNYINNSTNGYGGTPDDWTSSAANPVQGGIPTLTKAELLSILGIADGDVEGLWPCNAFVNTDDLDDLSSNNYDLDCNGHTPDLSSDGLMGSCMDLEAGNSDYGVLADASCPNLEISGSQTWFCFVKPESFTNYQTPMGKCADGGATAHRFLFGTGGDAFFTLNGLTTNGQVASDVKLQSGKWQLVVGVYDSVAQKLKIFINGIKTEVTASGSAGDTNGSFYIGRHDGTNTYYYDGLIQNAGILSVALTDSQVKQLFEYTLYKGQKIRRATSDAYLYQELSQDLISRLRGKTITLRGSGYCSSVNHGIYIQTRGAATATTYDKPAAPNTWEDLSVTITVPVTATAIQVGVSAETTDGNSWFKELSLYEGGTLLPFSHSKDDWSRFPRLLRLDIPEVISGYQFEEKRWYSYAAVFTSNTNVQTPNASYTNAEFLLNGKEAHLFTYNYFDAVSTPNQDIQMTLPVRAVQKTGYFSHIALVAQAKANTGNAYAVALSALSNTNLKINVRFPQTFAVSDVLGVSGVYGIN